MDQDIPEGYYSLAEVFNYLGQDVFKSTWTGKEIEIGKDNLLHTALPDFEAYMRTMLEPFLKGIHFEETYKSYLNLNGDLWDDWHKSITDLTKLFERRISEYAPIEQQHIKLADFVKPKTSFENAQDFIACTMRYLSTRKRLMLMLDAMPLKVWIKDTKTDAMREIPASRWLISENGRKDDLKFDLFNSSGTYGYHNSHMFEIYTGPFIISKKAFINFREGRHPEYEGKNNAELYQELLDEQASEKSSQRFIPKGSDFMIALFKCYEDLKVSLENQPYRSDVESWIQHNAKEIIKSQNDKKAFYTFLRESSMKKGGRFTGNAKTRQQSKKKLLSKKVKT